MSFKNRGRGSHGIPFITCCTANLCTEYFETKAFQLCNVKSSLWRRCVDDVLAIWCDGHEKLEAFLCAIPQQSNSINTIYRRKNKTKTKHFPSLTSSFRRNKDRTLSDTVYRKPTHTGRYFNYRSFHHPRIKSSVCKALVHRVNSICDSRHLEDEFKHLHKVLR